MSKTLKSITLIFVFLSIFILAACSNNVQKSVYTLSEHEKQLVDKIYSHKSIWEKHNGKTCSSIRFVEKNGNQFLLCSYNSTAAGVDFMGQGDVYVSTEIKYTISTNGMHEATLKEYGSSDYGIVTGMFSYDVNAKTDDKKLSLARAITNKSMVVIP
ncbi:MAG: hypothetical protein IJO74_06575 [Clostridia bacterium]|nr:hypothetical protein [Clostridia bacterium]